ncbi:MAG: DUF2490 domain-containing protein [Chitinophagales bacterium]
MKKEVKYLCVSKFALLNIIILLLNSGFIWAQTSENKLIETSETELWQGISVKKKITKKWSVGLEENIRLSDSGRRFETGLLETMLQYKLLKNIKLKAAYRYSFKPVTTANRQRLSVSASGKWKVNKRWKWSHRVKYQYAFVRNRQESSKVLRYKTELTYNIRKSKWNPFFSAECFYRFSYKENLFDAYRLAIGADYKWHKRQTFNIAYMQEKELNENLPKRYHIFYLAYSFDI